MLRMNHTNDDLEYFFDQMDSAFELLDNVIQNSLQTINEHEKQIDLSDLK
jgi:hypothetical protein